MIVSLTKASIAGPVGKGVSPLNLQHTDQVVQEIIHLLPKRETSRNADGMWISSTKARTQTFGGPLRGNYITSRL